jgi:hypothetical protein
MRDDSGFYGPLLYQDAWLWLGVAVLVLLAGWYAWLFLPARHRATVDAPLPVEALRAACLQAIDAVAAEVDAGRLGERDAHQRLSFLVREFASAVTKQPATHMTLAELDGHGLAPFAEAVAGLYPAEFAPANSASVRKSAAMARRVVLEWN